MTTLKNCSIFHVILCRKFEKNVNLSTGLWRVSKNVSFLYTTRSFIVVSMKKSVKNVSGTPFFLQLPPQHVPKKVKKVRGIMYCLVCPPPIQPFLGLIRPYFGKKRHFYTLFAGFWLWEPRKQAFGLVKTGFFDKKRHFLTLFWHSEAQLLVFFWQKPGFPQSQTVQD